MDCIFCRISSGEVPSEIVYQDKEAFAIRDIHPQAPKHLLIIPRQHIPTLADVPEGHEALPEEKIPIERELEKALGEVHERGEALLGHLVAIANLLARKEGIAQGGYRVVINSGRDSGQEVPHLHLHLLGGRRLGRLG